MKGLVFIPNSSGPFRPFFAAARANGLALIAGIKKMAGF